MSIQNIENLCISCMREKPDRGICPFCGFDESQYDSSPHHLTPRSILGGKYLIGRVLGEGGFGITYIGLDLNLDLKLAIKEYYPTGFVTRTSATTSTVTPFRGEKTEFFTAGRARFINEAKTLARFYTLPGIVSVRDFFQENSTAYIVMEFVEGETLKQRLARVGGKMDTAEVLELMRPLLRSLAEMHASGLIHRDISPDNIMITPDNFIKLIDFGAAREYLDSGNRSLSVMLKPGYAPEEQYFSRGQQGPWTDIYALCATIYRAITGVTPQESVERLRHDELQAPSALGARLTPAQDAALLKGLSVSQKERWQSIPEVLAALFSEEGGKFGTMPQAAKRVENPKKQQTKVTEPEERSVSGNSSESETNDASSTDISSKRMVTIVVAVALLVTFLFLLISSKSCAKKSAESAATPAASLSPSLTQAAEEDEYQVFPLKRRALVPASEQDALFQKALALLDQGKLAEAMATYDFSQRLDASIVYSSMLNPENRVLISCDSSDVISKTMEFAPAVAVSSEAHAALHADGTISRADYLNGFTLGLNVIVKLRTSQEGVVGIKLDGTLFSTFFLPSQFTSRTDLIDFEFGRIHYVALTSDGTVVAWSRAVDNLHGNEVEDWKDIVMISAGNGYTAGLLSDGTVITTNPDVFNTSDWHDIISINADEDVLAGIDVDGNVHLSGDEISVAKYAPALKWTNIVALDKGSKFMVGLQADGTVVAFGDSDDYMSFEMIEGKKSW